MLLGLYATAVCLLYGGVKYATAFAIQRRKKSLLEAQCELQKLTQDVNALEVKVSAKRTRQQTLSKETNAVRRIIDERHARLQGQLPEALQPELEKYRDLASKGERAERVLLNRLGLPDKIAGALNGLSLLAIEVQAEDKTTNVALVKSLAEELEKIQTTFQRVDQQQMLCLFDQPGEATHLLNAFLQNNAWSQTRYLKGGLCTGAHIPGGGEPLDRIFSWTLQHARDLCAQALPGNLLMNETAFRRLPDFPEIRKLEKEGTEPLYIFSWEEEREKEREEERVEAEL